MLFLNPLLFSFQILFLITIFLHPSVFRFFQVFLLAYALLLHESFFALPVCFFLRFLLFHELLVQVSLVLPLLLESVFIFLELMLQLHLLVFLLFSLL